MKFYRDEKQVNPKIVYDIAAELDNIGGVGLYDAFTHIDLRPRNLDGNVAKWDWRTRR